MTRAFWIFEISDNSNPRKSVVSDISEIKALENKGRLLIYGKRGIYFIDLIW